MQITQQEQKWLVLLYSLMELNGGGLRRDVLQHIQESGYWYKNDENDQLRTTRKEKAWRNDFSYERQHLVEQGYMQRNSHGVWAITEEGKQYTDVLIAKLKNVPVKNAVGLTLTFYTKILPAQTAQDIIADQNLVDQLSKDEDTSVELTFTLSDQPTPKGPATHHEGNKSTYLRDASVSRRALALAGHRCEVDASHNSFLRRNGTHLYMEPHHLIPMSMTDYFGVSLDREQNIFSLCSNCHNQIHYGRKEDVQQLILKLFLSREQAICSILGRRITLADIYRIYGVL